MRIVLASLDELPVTREARLLLDVAAASLFMVPLVPLVLSMTLLVLEFMVAAGLTAALVALSVEPVLVDPLLGVVVPAVPLMAGLGTACMVGSVDSGGLTVVDWLGVGGVVAVPGALPVAVCALAKPIKPAVAAITTADVRIFDAFMCLAP